MDVKKEFVTVKLDDIIPYKNNPRQNDNAVPDVAESIRQVGDLDPIEVDENNVILSGHTRLKALRTQGFVETDVVRYTGLSEEQKRKYRYLANKTGEKALWDEDLLEFELDGLDFGDFSFALDFGEPEEPETGKYVEKTIDRLRNIENLEVAEFPGDGEYGIPIIEPTYELPEIREWIPFNYVLSDKDPEGKGVHFFIHDYQFERVWNEPERYMEKLKAYSVVLAPDFSPYLDMPRALRIYNTYRRNWCAAYWQANGITVIPVVRACEEDEDFCFEGIPHNAIIAVSSMGLMRSDKDLFMDGYEVDVLNPKKILVYSNVPKEAYKDMKCEVDVIPSFSRDRWNKE